MRIASILVLTSLLLAANALAQDSGRTLLAQQREATKEVPREAPIPEKIPAPPSQDPPPTVTIRTDERTGDRVEEYRVNGRLQMVKVTPLRGAPYYFLDSNGDGKLDRKDTTSNVHPVYWTIYEWD